MTSHTTRSLALVALSHFTIELSNNFLPVVYPLLISSLGLSYAQVGVVAFVGGVGTSLTQPVFGYFSDRWYPQLIVILSVAWTGTIMSLVGLAWSFAALLLVVALGALGSAAFHPSGATIAAISARSRRGAAVSIFSVGGNLGAALSPLWITAWIGWLGMRGTVILLPVVLGISLVLYVLMGKGGRSGIHRKLDRQTTAGGWYTVGLVLIVVAMLFRAWFQVSLMTYLPAWVQDQGGSLAAGGNMLFVLLACVGAGSLMGGALSDRVGRWQVLVLSLALLGPAEWFFLGSSGLVQIALLGTMGALLGATFPVSIVLAQEVWPRGLGVASGLVMGLPWIGGGVGAWFTGVLADRFSLTVALQSLALPAILAAASMLAYAALQQPRIGAHSRP
jgi:FSR family fosmidomycin resistance protein-like MFS transporter